MEEEEEEEELEDLEETHEDILEHEEALERQEDMQSAMGQTKPSNSSPFSSGRNSPVLFDMSSADPTGTSGLGEKRDGSDGQLIPVMPWRGLLRKANSKVNLNQ